MEDRIQRLFPQFDGAGQALVRKAYDVALAALEGKTRENGHPFMEHPENVALIATDEIGLPAECAAAVFLHEAIRMGSCHPERSEGSVLASFPVDVVKMVEGLNKISTIKPKDTQSACTASWPARRSCS